MTFTAREHSSGERLDSAWRETPPGLPALVDEAPGPPLGQQQVHDAAVAPDALRVALASVSGVVDALRDSRGRSPVTVGSGHEVVRLVLAGAAALVDDLVRGGEGQLPIGEGHVDVGLAGAREAECPSTRRTGPARPRAGPIPLTVGKTLW